MNTSLGEDAFRLLFEAAPDAILVVSASGLIRLNNAEAERLLDAAVGELRGMPVEKLVLMPSRRHHVGLRENFQKLPHRRPMGMGLSLKAIKLSGREFPVEISLAPTHSEHGQEVIVILRDVSDRLNARRTERELVRAKALARVSQLAVQEREFDVLANEAVAHCETPLGASFVALFQKDSATESLRCRFCVGPVSSSILSASSIPADQLVSTDALVTGTPVLVGDTLSLKLSISPVLSEAGVRSLVIAPLGDRERTTGVLIAGSTAVHFFTTDDVAFLEAVANIVSNAQQRTNAEAKLLLSQRLESLGQLTGGVAHDFNNLLTVISGNLQILEDTVPASQFTDRAINAAHRATKRGAELTAKLLAFSRRQNLRPEALAVPELASSFRDLLERTLGPNIEIVVQAAVDLPAVLADAGQLETALLNLAVNSRDAMPSGGRISITATELARSSEDLQNVEDLTDTRYVRITVSDTGTGMNRDTLARAFEPFFTTKAVGKGSGLGLSMVYGFAKQSHGHVTAFSEPGKGTTVNLFLPAAKQQEASAPTDVIVQSTLTGSEQILIVEDDPDVLAVARSFLEGLGYRVFTASHRRAAVAHLRAHPDIALLFTDVVLAGNETGPKVAATLRKIKPELRVLYASGYARSMLPLQLGKTDDLAFLRKPYSREQLGQAIRQQLG